ncbi:MAG TPA: hypothetical protein VGH03_00190 [Caulobacteraceae bacterium]|jgi:hypothetical protein
MTKLLLAALAVSVAASAAQAAPSHSRNDTPCFFINQWQGWRAPDDHTLYLGVNYRDVYKVGLAGSSPILQDPQAHIVSITRGPDTVCNPVDLQLSIVEPPGIREPLIAKSLVKLTPDEVKAIPPKYRPY